jgi:hypothetical protein
MMKTKHLVLAALAIAIIGLLFEAEIRNYFKDDTQQNYQKEVSTSHGVLKVNKKNEAHVPPPRYLESPDYNHIVTTAKLLKQAADQDEMQSFVLAKESSSFRVERLKMQFWEAKSSRLEKEVEAEKSIAELERIKLGDDTPQNVVAQSEERNIINTSPISDVHSNRDALIAALKKDVSPFYLTAVNKRDKSVSVVYNGAAPRKVRVGQQIQGYRVDKIDFNSQCALLVHNTQDEQYEECF